MTILAYRGSITVRQPIDTEPGGGGRASIVGRVILSAGVRVGSGNVKLIAAEGGSVSHLGGSTYDRVAIHDVGGWVSRGGQLSRSDLSYSSVSLGDRWAGAWQDDRSNETLITLLNRYFEEMLAEKAGKFD